tara:strand:- start:154 stop:729 length:576 start_codon:yes stop_codon:yes gene_type:complete
MVKFKGELHGRMRSPYKTGAKWVSRSAKIADGMQTSIHDKNGNELQCWFYDADGDECYVCVQYNERTVMQGPVSDNLDQLIATDVLTDVSEPFLNEIKTLKRANTDLKRANMALEKSTPEGIRDHVVRLIHYRTKIILEEQLGELGESIVSDIETDISANLSDWGIGDLNLGEMTEDEAEEAKEGLGALFG